MKLTWKLANRFANPSASSLANLLTKITVFAVALIVATSIAGQAQTNLPATAEQKPAVEKAPVEILNHKIGVDYYPMLDRPGMMSAENGDMPMTEAEQLARQRTRTNGGKVASAPIAPGDTRSRGRLRSYTRVIDDAQLVQATIKNTETKPIKRIDWDFAFPRYENGQLLSRYDVITNAEIKPGGKKTLKHRLPTGAKKCEVVKVVSDEAQPEKVSTFEAVCGQGFHDLSLLKQKQQTILIKRIEYADGSVWQRKE